MAAIAFIVGNSGALDANYETPFKDRMENDLGHTVTIFDDSVAEATDFSSYDAIVSSMLCSEGSINGLKATEKPHLFMENLVTDDYGFGDQGTGTGNETQVDVEDNTHYITNPYAEGNLTVQASDNQKYFTNWANDVNPICLREGSATNCIIAVIDDGETLADSSEAAERRVFFGLYQGDDLDSTGWNIFDRAVGWCLYADAGAESGSADLSANFVIRKSSQADLSSNVTIQNKSQADLSASVTIRNKGQYDLSSSATIQNRGQYDLSSSVTIQNKAQYDLSVNVTIRKSGQADLSSNVTIQNKGQYDLSTNVTIQNRGQADLSASFTIGTDRGYITLADALVHNIPISSQTHTIELSNSNLPKQLNYRFSMHNIVVTAATHDIELSDQTHQIVISSEPLK